MIRLLEGSKAEDRGDYLVVSTPQNPTYWWGNFLLLAQPPQPGEARKWLARFAEEFPAASHVALGIDVTEASMIDNRELIAAGLRMERSSVLIAAELREPLATLGLSWPTTLDAVKSRYKELAKRHHPDANGGDRAAEERLKTINLAYAAVRSRLVAAPSVAAVG